MWRHCGILLLALTALAPSARAADDLAGVKWLQAKAFALPKYTATEGEGYFSIIEGLNRRLYIGTHANAVNSWLVEFAPKGEKMDVVVDCHKAIGKDLKGFGSQAKIHTRNNVGISGRIYFGTKQGYPSKDEKREDYPGGYPMVYDPLTRTTKVYPIPVPHEGINSITPDEARGVAYISTCSDGRPGPGENSHFLVLDLKTGKYRNLIDTKHIYGFIVVDYLGRAYHPMLGGDIVRYDPTTDKVERLKQTIDGQAPTAASNLANPGTGHPINWDISPDGKTLYSLPMSTNQLYAYDLTQKGGTLAGKSLGTLVPGAKSTDCRAMCVGPTGTVWAAITAAHPKVGQLLHLVSYRPGDRAPVQHGPVAIANPNYTEFVGKDGKPLPFHGGLIKVGDVTTTRHVILGVCEARDGNVYILALQPYTLLQVPPAQLRRPGQVRLIDEGQARCAIVAPKRVLEAKAGKEPADWRSLDPAVNVVRLRDSVQDLAAVLGRMTGAKVDIVADALPAGDKRVPIYIGETGKSLGQPTRTYPHGQGFRLVASPRGVALVGESDLGTSYAIYTLLDQLGCRWYIPGPKGEVLPEGKTVSVTEQDVSTGPYTDYRGMWYVDHDFGRRNRMGGMALQAGHALEMTVPAELRKKHPEIRAMIKGQPDNHKVKWTHPLVAQAISEAILAQLAKQPNMASFSLSPDDGVGWDESDDRKHDAGDFDAAIGEVSKTDRLMVLANRVAATVTKKYPAVKFGLLAYADYIRPPVREKVHPAVVPQIAPITFSRAQPMTDDGEPNNKGLRFLVEGWGKAVPATSYYFYAFYLAEASAPNPMIVKWGVDAPLAYHRGACRYWQPETLPNFETCMHALILGNRLAWDPDQSPLQIVDELHEKFYGEAAREMADYWSTIDRAWIETPEYAGCGFGHLRRWTPEVLRDARQRLEQAKAVAKSDAVKRRIALADESLALFEQFMQMRRDLAEGKWAGLGQGAQRYVERMEATAAKHRPEYAFSYVPWAQGGKGGSLNAIYFKAFYEATYLDAARVAAEKVLLTPTLRQWRWQQDAKKTGQSAGWAQPGFDDTRWPTTDVAVDTWSRLGLHNYMGSLWYRTTVKLPEVPTGKKVHLWIGATDGAVKIFVNGVAIPHVGPKGEKTESFTGHCQPTSFDITAAIKPGASNQISVFATRTFLNELGTGGLLVAPVIYREK
ncbi:MAG: DUF4838 domain-containing protein [Gemmataceae bacterium]